MRKTKRKTDNGEKNEQNKYTSVGNKCCKQKASNGKGECVKKAATLKMSSEVQHPFMIKTYQSGYSGNIPQNNKSYLRQTHKQYNAQW